MIKSEAQIGMSVNPSPLYVRQNVRASRDSAIILPRDKAVHTDPPFWFERVAAIYQNAKQ